MNEPSSVSIGAAAQHLVQVCEPTDVGEARRRAAALAQMLRFDETLAARLAIAVTEACMNIVKHATKGCMLVRALQRAQTSAIEVLALDQGDGIGNVDESMRDGYSTAGSPGTGLGALARLTREFQIVSFPGRGTALRFEVGPPIPEPHPPAPVAVGTVCIPKSGESACGDAWALTRSGGLHTLVVVDGLGHGPDAAAAAHAAVDLAVRHAGAMTPAGLIDTLHHGMRATRGAAVAAIALDPGRESGTLCGVGNIGVSVHNAGAPRKLVSHNGIVGHQVRKIQEFGFSFAPGGLLIAHSDGLDTRWRLEDHPGLENAHPALIAGILYRDHQRGRDDATVVVVRNAMESGR